MRPGDLAARLGGPELAAASVIAWLGWAAARGALLRAYAALLYCCWTCLVPQRHPAAAEDLILLLVCALCIADVQQQRAHPGPAPAERHGMV